MGITGSTLCPVFSQEILDEIIGHLDPECRYDLNTLRVCALSCPQLRHASQKRIFNKIRLPLSAYILNGSVHRLRTILDANPRLGTYVKILSIVEGVDPGPFPIPILNDEDLACVVAHLTRLRALTWVSGSGTDWLEIPVDFQEILITTVALPSLTELRLAGFFHFPLSILNCSRNLKLLKLQSFINALPDPDLPMDIDGLTADEIKLDAFSLVMGRPNWSHHMIRYFDQHTGPFKLDSLKRLSLNVINDPSHTPIVQGFIDENAATLDHLILHPLFTENDDEDNLAEINLDELTRLRRISVHFSLPPYDMPSISFPWLKFLFDNTPDNTVKHVIISIHTSEDGVPEALSLGDWEGIAECLCDDAFSSLESVEISIFAPKKKWEDMVPYARSLKYHMRTLDELNVLWVTVNDESIGASRAIEF